MVIATLKLTDGTIRAFRYPSIAAAQRDARTNGANIQAVQPIKAAA